MTKGSAENADAMKKRIEEQLKTLKTDYFDFYGYHGINNQELYNEAFKKNGPIEALVQLKEEGVIKHIGFSTHAPLDVILKSIETDYFDFVNLHFYYFFQRNYPAIALAKSKDMGVLIISPNDKGGQLWNASEKVKKTCHPLTPIQFSGRFCLSHPEVHTLTMGFHELEQFDDQLGIINDGLYFSQEDRRIKSEMDALSLELGDSYCTYCTECLPCPENINIPEVLRFRNMLKGYEMLDFGKYRYNMLEGKGHWFPGRFADVCTDCGDCLPRCPVKLPIPSLLKETHKALYVEKET
jgi:predicted aldo/keto reductase-like oxidoreductase